MHHNVGGHLRELVVRVLETLDAVAAPEGCHDHLLDVLVGGRERHEPPYRAVERLEAVVQLRARGRVRVRGSSEQGEAAGSWGSRPVMRGLAT